MNQHCLNLHKVASKEPIPVHNKGRVLAAHLKGVGLARIVSMHFFCNVLLQIDQQELHPERLIIILAVSQARIEMMRDMLKVSSLQWDSEEANKQFTTGERQFVTTLRAAHAFSKPALQQLAASTFEGLPVQITPSSADLRNFFWALTARAAGTIFHYVFQDELRGPFPLLSLDDSVNPQERAERILASPTCLHDGFTRDFLRRYDSPERLLCTSAVAEREALLVTTKWCISRIEARHSALRRMAKTNSLQSRASDLCGLSAGFLLRSTPGAEAMNTIVSMGGCSKKKVADDSFATTECPNPTERQRRKAVPLQWKGHISVYTQATLGNGDRHALFNHSCILKAKNGVSQFAFHMVGRMQHRLY